VASGATCFIVNTYITGNVVVAAGGSLDELDRSYVGGSVTATNAVDADVNNTTIKGGLTINGSGTPGSINFVICNNSIGAGVVLTNIPATKEINFGDVDLVAVNAVAPCHDGGGNSVTGALQLTNNAATPIRVQASSFTGGGTVTGNPAGPIFKNNTFGGALNCSNNGPGVTGSGNSFPAGSSCPNL
jgi:hypothetical protein